MCRTTGAIRPKTAVIPPDPALFMSHRPPPRRTANRPGPPAQPPIWAEGRQDPPFAVGAFLAVSLVLARRSLGPWLKRAATALDRWGHRWRSGALRVDCARPGRAANLIRAQQTTGRALLWLAQLTGDAGRIVLPGQDPDLPHPDPDLLTHRTDPAPITALRPQRPTRRLALRIVEAAAPEEPILLTIRSLLAQPARDAAADPACHDAVLLHPHLRVEHAPQRPLTHPTAAPATTAQLRSALSLVLATMLIGVVIIPAAVRAILLHLNGTDLRHWQ